MITGRFKKNYFGPSRPRGDTKKHEKKRTQKSHAGAIQKNEKTHTQTPPTHKTATATSHRQQVDNRCGGGWHCRWFAPKILSTFVGISSRSSSAGRLDMVSCCLESIRIFMLTLPLPLVDITLAVSYPWMSGSEPIIIAYTPARPFTNATPQCMLARYSFEWMSDNLFLKEERLKRVWFSQSASDFVGVAVAA